MADTLDITHAAIAPRIGSEKPLVVGLCGAQGSGKSTVAAAVARRLEADGVAATILSLDDLYLTKAERRTLAATIHPLLATRGVPGTHDVARGIDILATLDRRQPARIPAFDKATDDRASEDRWTTAPSDTRVILFEGWCVGARPQSAEALAAPINALERDEDPDANWRHYVNDALAGGYQRLFGRIDIQILLAAPAFEVVQAWRSQQENDLRACHAADSPDIMSDAAIARFIQHYERLTRHILTEMPGRADLVVDLDHDRHPIAAFSPARDRTRSG